MLPQRDPWLRALLCVSEAQGILQAVEGLQGSPFHLAALWKLYSYHIILDLMKINESDKCILI